MYNAKIRKLWRQSKIMTNTKILKKYKIEQKNVCVLYEWDEMIEWMNKWMNLNSDNPA